MSTCPLGHEKDEAQPCGDCAAAWRDYVAHPDRASLLARLAQITEEKETLNLQLAACTIAALGNTEATKAQRIHLGHPYFSASYQDVCNAVDREMSHRTRAEQAEADLALNVTMLAKQCDLARQAEADLAALRAQLKSWTVAEDRLVQALGPRDCDIIQRIHQLRAAEADLTRLHAEGATLLAEMRAETNARQSRAALMSCLINWVDRLESLCRRPEKQ